MLLFTQADGLAGHFRNYDEIGGLHLIIHNVFFKLKDRSQESIARTRDVLLSMKDKIDYVQDLRVEADILHASLSYDLALIATFSSMEDLQAYVDHPAHIEVSKYIETATKTAAALCYQT